VRQIVRSRAYARARAVSGTLFIVLGAAILIRTVVSLGVELREVPALVLGCALVGLGALRLRDYRIGEGERR